MPSSASSLTPKPSSVSPKTGSPRWSAPSAARSTSFARTNCSCPNNQTMTVAKTGRTPNAPATTLMSLVYFREVRAVCVVQSLEVGTAKRHHGRRVLPVDQRRVCNYLPHLLGLFNK